MLISGNAILIISALANTIPTIIVSI
jgi:hypothetical protein